MTGTRERLTALKQVDAGTLECLNRLIDLPLPSDPYPVKRRAAVLVCLFSRNGTLNVILSTRSNNLRSHPGQVSLPGGKADEDDIDLESTARREAWEEIGLPMGSTTAHLLAILPPQLSPNDLLVTPVVVYLLDTQYKPILNASEVSDIFSHPLRYFLYHTLPEDANNDDEFIETLKSRPYHTATDYSWKQRPPHRFHSFTSRRGKSITGFTASILINVAEIAFAQPPEFVLKAPGSLTAEQLIELSLRQPVWAGSPSIGPEHLGTVAHDKASKL